MEGDDLVGAEADDEDNGSAQTGEGAGRKRQSKRGQERRQPAKVPSEARPPGRQVGQDKLVQRVPPEAVEEVDELLRNAVGAITRSRTKAAKKAAKEAAGGR